MHWLYTLLIICISARVYGYFWIEEGGPCQKQNGEIGSCTHFTKCPSAIEEVRRNGRPEICSFNGIYPIVCCVSSSKVIGERYNSQEESYNLPFDEYSVSSRKCREYYSEQSGGGSKYSKIQHHTHIALLGFPKQDKIVWACAGALISETFVLTSAHCVNSKLYGRVKYIRLGGIGFKLLEADSETYEYPVKAVYPHQLYESSSGYYDIALIELNTPARFTDYIKPACLAVTENLNGTLPELTGFGVLEEHELYKRLSTDYYDYVPNDDCNRMFQTREFLKHGIDESQICAITDTCHVDTGGPLQFKNFYYEFGNFPEIVGISSFSKGCGMHADVFTRVYSHVPWIERIVWPGQ